MTRPLGTLVALLLLVAAPGSPLLAQNGEVVFERTGYRLTSLGGRVSAAARVLDARRRAVPNAPIAWRIDDSAIATVNHRGVVQSRRVGRTRLWAVSGRDSASALILVDQWAARFVFVPAVLTFGAVRETRTVQVQARDASGNAIPGIRLSSACRIMNPGVASLEANGRITANSSGVTYLRCADRGVADSLRVEVRQRPASAQIADKALYANPRPVGEQFQLRMRALDSAGNVITEARPTWASLEPRVLNIDPLTGAARGVGVGTSKVVAQLADITDTLDIIVVGGAGMNLAPVLPAGTGDTAVARPGRAQLAIYSLPTAVGDTTALTVIPRDQSNQLVEVSAVTLRLSGDTGVARLTRDRRLIGLKEGQVWIVGSFAAITDSTPVTIRPAGTTARMVEAEGTFVRPGYDTAAVLNRNRLQRDSVMQAILASSVVRTAGNRMIAAQASVAQTSHAARLSDTYMERRTGMLFGGQLSGALFRALSLTANYRFGTLAPEGAVQIEDMRLTEVDAALAFNPTRWFSLEAGGTRRVQATEIAAQRWQFVRATALLRPGFIGDRVRVVAAFSILPYGQLNETASVVKNIEPTSFAGDAGLEFRVGVFGGALMYRAERISFPIENRTQRIDRFSTIGLRVGLQLGQ